MAAKPKILFIIWPFTKRFVDASLDTQVTIKTMNMTNIMTKEAEPYENTYLGT